MKPPRPGPPRKPLEPARPGSLRVTEHFLCVEGEGRTLGALTYLVRLSGCDLRCWWCDSKFSSFREDEARDTPPAALAKAARASGAAWVSFTGGEPTWRGEDELDALARLAAGLRRKGLRVKVETNGLRLPTELLAATDLWSVAPKYDGRLGRATVAMRWDPAVLARLARGRKVGSLQFKFVITFDRAQPRASDLAWAAEVLAGLGPAGRRHPAYIIPEAYAGGDYLDRLRALETAVMALAQGPLRGHELHVQPQWHRVLHGDERGR